MVRVYPSGKMSYVIEYARGKRYTIGSTGVLKAKSAREKAAILLGQAKDGKDPHAEKPKTNASTLKNFITKIYAPWAKANRKDGENTIKRLESRFDHLMKFKLSDLSAWQIEKWRSERIKSGTAKSTINRDLVTLKEALTKAVEWKILDTHPLRSVQPLKIDSAKKVRYLAPDEELALRAALRQRDDEHRAARDNANRWREKRGYKL